MFRNKLLFTFLFASIVLTYAQNNTNTPYTMYGYGEINDNYSGEQRAMGGTAIGARSKTSINTVNPASYSAVDTMTFMFDMGTSVLGSRFTLNNNGISKLNANLEYLTMQFPLWKNTGMSMGVLPYSFTGYNYATTQILPLTAYPDTVTATRNFFGEGGISQAYTGFSIKLFKRLSIGANVYYMFGKNLNNRVLTFDNDEFTTGYQKDSINVSSFRLRYGVQYKQPINEKSSITLGAFFEQKAKLNATYSASTGSKIDTPEPFVDQFEDFEMPQTIGIGFNYLFDKRLTVSADYSLQQWINVKFMGVSDTLTNRNRIALGAEFISDPRGRKYFNRVAFRAGLNMSDPYYKVNGITQPKNFGITFGMGLPLRNSKSVVNATFEYGKIGSSTVLREDYMKFTLNAVINENWFFKRKL